jgi:response regulator RpfG family c-di-GMP phosphodiesterase
VFPTMYVKRFNDGFSVVKSLEKEKLEVIFICEYNIQGINGLQILKKIRSEERLKDSYFIMMSESSDREILIKSVQAGADDFLPKPISYDLFVLKLKTAAKSFTFEEELDKLKAEYEELKKELEPQADRLVVLFKYLQSARLPEREDEIKRIVSAANFIAKQLSNDPEDLNQIALAAELCHVPKILFKDKYLEMPIMVSGIVQNPVMAAYNDYVKNMFADLKGFEKILTLLNGVYENFDGSGMPNKIKAWEIPLGSRIIRVVSDFEYFYYKNPKNLDRIIPMMWNEINRLYDFRVLAFYDQYLAYLNTMNNPGRRASEVVVNPFVLEKGMVLSRSIITISGLKLLNVGSKLDAEAIKKIQEAKNADAYIGHIFIKVESLPQPTIKK